MTRADLILALGDRFPALSIKEIDQAVKHIFEMMTTALEQSMRIEIRGFGSFAVRQRPPRLARNPKTGKVFHTEGKCAAHFKPGKELRMRVNTGKALTC